MSELPNCSKSIKPGRVPEQQTGETLQWWAGCDKWGEAVQAWLAVGRLLSAWGEKAVVSRGDRRAADNSPVRLCSNTDNKTDTAGGRARDLP